MTDLTPTVELHLSRTFAAPRELVFAAFVEPALLARWFGPEGWSVDPESIDIDPRPGGNYHLTLVDDSDPARRSPTNAKFTDIVENECIASEETWDAPGIGPTEMHLIVEFADDGDGTRLTLRQGPYTPRIARMAQEGWERSFATLDKLLDPG
ncbi:MAG TPA: SRPBCC domain-containing protein [Acidimicrobiales bacterium]